MKIFVGKDYKFVLSGRHKTKIKTYKQNNKKMTESVYSFSYCGTIITKDGTPNQSGCSSRSSHYWQKLGEVGNDNYQCRDCKIVVKTKSTPSQSGCTKARSHYWKKL